MRVLVIPDIHLRTWIFDRAEDILKACKEPIRIRSGVMVITMSAIRGGGLRPGILLMQSGQS